MRDRLKETLFKNTLPSDITSFYYPSNANAFNVNGGIKVKTWWGECLGGKKLCRFLKNELLQPALANWAPIIHQHRTETTEMKGLAYI